MKCMTCIFYKMHYNVLNVGTLIRPNHLIMIVSSLMFSAIQEHVLKKRERKRTKLVFSVSISCSALEFLQEGFVPSVSSVQTVDRQGDLIKLGRDVKKSTTVLDFMDY